MVRRPHLTFTRRASSSQDGTVRYLKGKLRVRNVQMYIVLSYAHKNLETVHH